MKFTEDFGILITDEVRKLILLAINKAGNRLQLAKQIGISNQTIYNWQGEGARKGQYITWDQWKPLRDYLAAHRALDASSPRWMLPSELRDTLQNGDAIRSDDEARLLDLFRALTPDGQQTALNILLSLQATLNKAPSGSAASPASSAPSAPSAG